ncbi:MAG TPA: DUF983 domain-containing protein [Gemmatimonadales bacterium]|jgi:uncharacterized protein (DUF983 family)|nr:DUF983 domain-containing protein [Gemmatimonadales bacterium]
MPSPIRSRESFFRRALRVTWRAARRRCPNCGGTGLFRSWFRMVATCPTCGLPLERNEEGYTVGAYMFNIGLAEASFLAVFLIILVSTWPNPPWQLLTWISAGLMVLLPLVFYPYSKTLFLGLHLLFHPVESERGPPT